MKKFLRLGLRVIIGCRSPEKVQPKFEAEISGEKLGGTVECFHLDLNSLNSVRTFAQAVISLNTPIHVLANNAGTEPPLNPLKRQMNPGSNTVLTLQV